MPTLTPVDDSGSHRVQEWSCNTFIGRRMVGGLSIDYGRPIDRQISSVHAALIWERSGQRWQIVDLASTNRTWIDGKALVPGMPRPLDEGMIIAFGDSAWRVEGLCPPPAAATSSHGDFRVGQDGVLLLPDERSPEWFVYRAGDGWRYRPWTADAAMAADADGGQPLHHGDQLTAGRCTWTIAVPSDKPLRTGLNTWRSRRLADYALTLDVSGDFETFTATLVGRGESIPLGARRHHELWWLLARARASQPDTTEGWIESQALLKQIGPRQSMGNLNVWVFRSRKLLLEKGFKDAEAFIERRQLANPELRLMDMQVDIRQHGDGV